MKGTAALIVLVVILLVAVAGGMTLLSYANTATDYEQDINKFDRASQNTLSNYTLKIQEMFQVPEEYKNALKEQIEATFKGRYGSEGSQATMQWIQERNLQFDSSMYKDLQRAMSAGRDEFKLSQDKKLEICTQYDKLTNRPVSKLILGILGYPSKGIDIKCRIVLDSKTIQTFETGIAEPIKLRN